MKNIIHYRNILETCALLGVRIPVLIVEILPHDWNFNYLKVQTLL